MLKNLINSARFDYCCSVCYQWTRRYLPVSSSIKKKALKNDFRYYGDGEHVNIEKYYCPHCGASDRDRLYAYYFKKIEKVPIESKLSILHLAPSWPLNNYFLKRYFRVTTADLNMEHVDVKVNIEFMEAFKDNSFDYLICSHILEHVNNPNLSLKELYRVLKHGGKAIIMVPIVAKLQTTLEDPKHKSEEERWKFYGQGDHLRLYSRNSFITDVKKSGFELKLYDQNDIGAKVFNKLGLKHSSTLYIGLKK